MTTYTPATPEEAQRAAERLFYYDLVDRVRRLHEGRMLAEQQIAQQNAEAKRIDRENVAAFEVQMQQASGKLFV